MTPFLDTLIEQYATQDWYITAAELVALICGIWSVWLAKKQHIGVYPIGLIATTLTMWLLYLVGFWGDMLVNLYFSIMSIYGWWKWSKKAADGSAIPPTYLSQKERLTGIGLFFLTLIVIFAVYLFFGTPMDWSHLIDLLTAGLFFTAMYFMALKKVESWVLWIIGDALVLPIYTYRGLYLLALQYLVLTVLAIIAYRSWKLAAQTSSTNLN